MDTDYLIISSIVKQTINTRFNAIVKPGWLEHMFDRHRQSFSLSDADENAVVRTVLSFLFKSELQSSVISTIKPTIKSEIFCVFL